VGLTPPAAGGVSVSGGAFALSRAALSSPSSNWNPSLAMPAEEGDGVNVVFGWLAFRWLLLFSLTLLATTG
jgi:hypothetical protein